jgi:hypothetical protein
MCPSIVRLERRGLGQTPAAPFYFVQRAQRSGDNVAKQHVAAVEKYPELAALISTQKDAITVAKNLDTLPEEERTQARARLMKHDQSTLALLAEKPPMPAATRTGARTGKQAANGLLWRVFAL